METKIINFSHSQYSATQNLQVSIPRFCPNCGVSNNPKTSFMTIDGNLLVLKQVCTDCKKTHYTLHSLNHNQLAPLITVHPNNQPTNLPEKVITFSPRFKEMFYASEQAESSNHIGLAGMGYRASLEILIKDYALDFKLDTEEKISKTNLNNAISKYLTTDLGAQSAADVVRILGNDYAHWNSENKFPLDILKAYLQIFIQIINTKLMLRNPPVSRNPKNS